MKSAAREGRSSPHSRLYVTRSVKWEGSWSVTSTDVKPLLYAIKFVGCTIGSQHISPLCVGYFHHEKKSFVFSF